MNSGRTGSVPFAARTMSADVLVVDDELDIRRSVSEVLRTSGFRVAEAEDGAVAYGLLSEHRYGMVLLDIRMPVLDGVSLVEALQEVPPIIVYSAYSLDAGERARLGTKVVRYLRKPVSPEQLLSAVQNVLGPDHGA
jgi:CheY-like chemotaxis protein